MKYAFQSASHIDDYLEAIAGSPEFIVKHDAVTGIIVLNYVFTCPTTFPDPTMLEGEAHRLAVLRRDCRGIKFDLATGDVVAKPYSKFFNVNQLPETQIGTIDWSRPHVILEKLDGSMITYFKHRNRNGSHQWHTKMGPTDVAEPVNAFAGEAYITFCEAMREDGKTAIFEFCSRGNRIVIDYPEPQLILTAIRANHAGTYASYPELVEHGARFGLPVVRALKGSVENAQQFLAETAALEGAEGYVIRFDNGHQVKIKGEWYCRIHNTKELFTLEKNVWDLILQNGVDDALPFMDDNDRSLIEQFSAEFERRVVVKANELSTFVQNAHGLSKKTFATETTLGVPKRDRSLMFQIWDGANAVVAVRNILRQHVGTQSAVDGVRDMLAGLDWRDFYN